MLYYRIKKKWHNRYQKKTTKVEYEVQANCKVDTKIQTELNWNAQSKQVVYCAKNFNKHLFILYQFVSKIFMKWMKYTNEKHQQPKYEKNKQMQIQ